MPMSTVRRSELQLTLTQLRRFRPCLINEGPPQVDTLVALDRMINTLELELSKRVENLSLSFTASDNEVLQRFNIVRSGVLHLQPEPILHEAIIASRAAGSGTVWSNDFMYQHLTFIHNNDLLSLMAQRMTIDSFFFRTIVMIPPPQKTILMLENDVSTVHPKLSQTDTVWEGIDYTVAVMDPSIAAKHFDAPETVTECDGDQTTAFFASVAQATASPAPFDDHLPRFLLLLFTLATRIGKAHVRGAITTGLKWRFVTMDLDPEGEGAKYWVSGVIEWRWKTNQDPTGGYLVEETSDEFDPALVTGILSSWVTASHEKFTGDEWFAPQLG